MKDLYVLIVDERLLLPEHVVTGGVLHVRMGGGKL